MLFGYIIEIPTDKDNAETTPKYALLVYDILDPDSPDESDVALGSSIRACFRESGRDVGVLYALVAEFAHDNNLVVENFSYSRVVQPTASERKAQLERAATEMAVYLRHERQSFGRIVDAKNQEIDELRQHLDELHMILNAAEGNGCAHVAQAKQQIFGKSVLH